MKKFLIAIPLIAALGACDTYNPNTGTLAGAALGAAAGAAVSGSDDKLLGAVIGGAAGAAAGSYLGRDSSGKCVYQNTDGSRYTGDWVDDRVHGQVQPVPSAQLRAVATVLYHGPRA